MLVNIKKFITRNKSKQETLVSELKSNLLHKDFQQQKFDSEKVKYVSKYKEIYYRVSAILLL